MCAQCGADAVDSTGHQARWRCQAAAALHAFGRDGGGRVDAHPAAAVLPDLGPGVGVALAYDEVAVLRQRINALVAGDDARGHVHGPHDDDESAGEMLAEAELAVEPELVDGVGAAVGARLQRVGVVIGADVLQHGARQHACIGLRQVRPLAQLRGPLQRARVGIGRQVHQITQAQHITPRAVAMCEPGTGLDALALDDRPVGLPLAVGAVRQQPTVDARRGIGAVGGHLQQRQQGQLAGLHRHLVAQRFALDLKLQPRALCGWKVGHQACPLAAVERAQYRAAEVHLLRLRHRPEKAQAQCDRVVFRDGGHTAQAQRARQPRAAHGILRQAPQRADAREQHEEQQHHRHAQRRRARRHTGSAPQRRPAHRHVGQHQCRQQAPHRHQQPQPGGQRLRIQEVREHQEEAQEEHHQRVAPRAQLQGLERHQHHQQRDAGLLAQQRALAPQREAGGQHQQAADDPAVGQLGGGDGQLRAPGQQRQRHHGAPGRQVQQVRGDGPGDDEQLEQRVARVARQVGQALACVGDHGHVANRSSAARRWASP